MEYGIVLLFLFMAVVFSSNGEEGKIFKCGSIKQPHKEEYPICVSQKSALVNSNEDYKIELGKNENQFCDTTIGWENPSSTPERAYGRDDNGDNKPVSWPPLPKLEDGDSLDGDYCTQDSHCYQHADQKLKGNFVYEFCFGDGNTPAGICTTSLKEGQDCDNDDRVCPANTYGNKLLGNSKCTKAAGVDESGDENVPCQYGLFGTQVLEQGPFKCKDRGAYEIHENFEFQGGIRDKFNVFEVKDLTFAFVNLGQTEIAVRINLNPEGWMCTEGISSDINNINHLKVTKYLKFLKKSPNDLCPIILPSHLNLNKSEINEFSSRNASGGFNNNPSAYCSPQIGDPYVINSIKKSHEKISLPNRFCHPLSQSPSSVPLCFSQLQQLNSTDVFNAYRRSTEAISQTYHLTAANEEGVKETLTQRYWMSRRDNRASTAQWGAGVIMLAGLMLF